MTLANPLEATAASDLLLAREVIYRTLKLALDRPTELSHPTLYDEQAREVMRQAAHLLEDGVSGELVVAIEHLTELPTPGLGELRRSHERLFGHTLRGCVCPYECEYGRQALLQQAQQLADLSGFYAAFGLRTRETRHERPDHVACQLEFLEFLVRKERWALHNADPEMAEATRQAARRFLRERLARFGRAFAHALQQAAPGEFYGSLGRVCEAFLRLECQRLDVPLGPEVLELRSAEPDDVPLACGSGPADDLVQLGKAESTGGSLSSAPSQSS